MNKDRMHALLMFSGGLDSTCLLWDMITNPKNYVENVDKPLTIHPVYCDYGNKNTKKEINSARNIIILAKEHLEASDDSTGVVVRTLSIATIPSIAGSITKTGGDCSHNGTFAKEYAPYRNATMIMCALSSLTNDQGNDFDYVYMGCHADDTTLKFPDCGKDFEKAMNKLLSLYHLEGVGQYPYVILPLVNLTKQEIIGKYCIPTSVRECVFSGYTDGKPPAIKIANRMGQSDDDDDEPIPPKPFIDSPSPAIKPATSLMVKEHEPLIIRKFTQYGFPLYVGMICGANLDNLDSVVHGLLQPQKERIQQGGIQNMRNIVGELSAKITETYGLKVEGVAVVWYVDKMMVSSLYGDFMTHTSCRIEFYSLLQMSCHV